MTNDLMLAILALDSYNRGYDAQLNVSGSQLGDATWLQDLVPSGNLQSIAFYATAYDWDGQTIISYRGTDTTFMGSEISNGYGVGAGSPFGPQAAAAIKYFQQVAKAEDPSLAPGGADAGDWQSADIELTGHSLGGGLAGFVGAIYGQQGTLFDNMTFNNAVFRAYNDATALIGSDPVGSTSGASTDVSAPAFPGWAQFVYGAGDENPYAPDYSRLTALATAGELLQNLLPLRFFQTPTVNYLDPHAGISAAASNLHSMALLTFLIYARDNNLTDWGSVGGALYDAYFNNELGTALGFKQGDVTTPGATGAGAPSSQMLAAIAYSALQGSGLPFGDTGIQSLFADADSLGELQNANVFTGLLAPIELIPAGGVSADIAAVVDPRTGVGALAEIAVQFAGDQAMAHTTDPTLAQGSMEVDGSTLKVDLNPSKWTSTFPQGSQPSSTTTAVVGLALQLPFLQVSESMGNHDSKIVDAASVD